MKIKNWAHCIQDRKNWILYVDKAKTFKELKLQRLEKKNGRKPTERFTEHSMASIGIKFSNP
jgi:hypothetical protein